MNIREMIKEELNNIISEDVMNKKLLKKEIDKLENALIDISDSTILQNSSTSNIYGKVFNLIKPTLNASKLDYETNYGKGNWKLKSNGGS